MYQLRGRVGRSNEQAYAYLLIPPLSSLPRATLRRLQALQEFTELGSGFNLAMRDLEIRGAGNLLGAEQSGFIMEMGFEMYQRIVEEAVAELKRQEFDSLFEPEQVDVRRKIVETLVEADIEAFIPDFFIESDGERLDIYRRLYAEPSLDQIQAMRLELRDRFGEYPIEVEHLFLLVELKAVAADVGFIKVELQNSELTLHFPPPETREFYEGIEGTTAPFHAIVGRLPELKQFHPSLKQDTKQLKLIATLDRSEDPQARITQARMLLEKLRDICSSSPTAV